MVSFILFNIYNFRPPKKKPTTLIVKVGERTSSIIYNKLKEGKAIALKIKAGDIVQINSINEPCVKYLYAIGFFLLL